MNEAPRQDEDILAPLIFFYGIGSTRPRVTFVEPQDLAEQERALLVHDKDMTPRLREFHASELLASLPDAPPATSAKRTNGHHHENGDHLVIAGSTR